MLRTNGIQYLYDRTNDMELILCSDSLISYPLHNHVSVFTVGLIVNGAITLTVNNKSRLCTANQSFVILPYEPHTIKTDHPYTLLTLCISKDVVMSCSKEKFKNAVRNLLVSTPKFSLTEFQIAQFVNSLDLVSGYPELHFCEPCIGFIKKQLECFPERQLSIDEMAQVAYISKYHFIRSFKQAVGLTPHQFQIQNRIRKAQHLINDVENITEVALTTGFCDQSHFIKCFEKHVGLTPTEYRISCRSI